METLTLAIRESSLAEFLIGSVIPNPSLSQKACTIIVFLQRHLENIKESIEMVTQRYREAENEKTKRILSNLIQKVISAGEQSNRKGRKDLEKKTRVNNPEEPKSIRKLLFG